MTTLGRTSQPAERPLVQLSPDPRAGAGDQEPDGLARVAQRQNEEPGPPVLAGVGIADHRSVAAVDLRFLSWSSSPGRCRPSVHEHRRTSTHIPARSMPDVLLNFGRSRVRKSRTLGSVWRRKTEWLSYPTNPVLVSAVVTGVADCEV